MIDDKYIYKKTLPRIGFSFALYLEKRFIQIYRPLYGDSMLVPLGGAQT